LENMTNLPGRTWQKWALRACGCDSICAYVLPYHSIFLHTHFGKSGKCRLKPTQTATTSSILCRRHGPIWPKLEWHVVSWPTCCDMLATFPAKLCRISTTSSIEVTYELLVSFELLRYHGVRSVTFRWELIRIRGPSLVSHARRLSCERSHPRLMETYPSVAGIEHYQRSRRPYAMRTWLSSFFESSLV
jgi:hypothetical protein